MIKPGWLFGAAIFFALLAIVGLRINHQKAVALKNQIVAQDAAGQTVDENIKKLQGFVFSHMNTSVSLELTGSYQRAVEAAKAPEEPRDSGELYSRAQAYCDIPGNSSIVQAECVQNYLEARLNPSENPEPVKLPERSRYQYSFAAPSWSADLPGISVLLALVLSVSSVVMYWVRLLRGQL
ncbi:MAG: hypothetical protein WDZ81_00615 [Candidatus Saccharimonadales bacterium]